MPRGRAGTLPGSCGTERHSAGSPHYLHDSGPDAADGVGTPVALRILQLRPPNVPAPNCFASSSGITDSDSNEPIRYACWLSLNITNDKPHECLSTAASGRNARLAKSELVWHLLVSRLFTGTGTVTSQTLPLCRDTKPARQNLLNIKRLNTHDKHPM